jgi:3-dehydroquinate synthase
MKKIGIKTANADYDVVIGANLRQLPEFLDLEHAFAVTESCVQQQWGQADIKIPVQVLEGGEQLKSLSSLENIYQLFLRQQLDKASTVIAVGGGAFTDAISFAAATFHRGIACVTVPTTLLAQVDASIGGKNAINFGGVKNLIGTISQPKLVLCDLAFLNTLPKSAISNGMAEVIKAAIIKDPTLFEFIRVNYAAILDLDEEVMEPVLSRAIQVKADIVSADEFESGERMKLNLGHTIGHALEAAYNLEHGQAVAYGMVLESKLAANLGLCSPSLVGQVADLCNQFNLKNEIDFDPEQVMDLMLQDKKRRAETINFALPKAIGEVHIYPIAINEIKKHLSNLCLN